VSGRNREIVVHAISEQAKAFTFDPSPAEPMPFGVTHTDICWPSVE
jgi:hypothetical protein